MCYRHDAYVDAVVGEGHCSIVVVEAIDPDDAVFGLEANGQVVNEAFFDAEALGDAADSGDVATPTIHREATAVAPVVDSTYLGSYHHTK
jgi:hypothetical protein